MAVRYLNLGAVRHAVMVAPHSDDETLGAFHTISALRTGGARVDVVVVTDGSASHRNSTAFPKSRLVAARQAETLNAMRLAGVPRSRIQFLGLPDGGLDTLTQRRFDSAVRNLRQRPVPDLLIVPSSDDDHPDHRDTARMCRAAWSQASSICLTYTVWPADPADPSDRNQTVSVYGNGCAKRFAIRRYRTQLGLIRDDPNGFKLTDQMLRRTCTNREIFKWQ